MPWAIRRQSCSMSTSASEPVSRSGRYFDGRSTRPAEVTLRIDAQQLQLEGVLAQRWALAQLSISERLGHAQRRILLPGGAFIEVADDPCWDVLPQQWGRSGLRLAWLESRWRHALAALLVLIVVCVSGYLYALPWLVERIALQVPATWVSELSRGTLDLIDRFYTAPSKLPAARQQQIRAALAAWRPAGEPLPAYRLHFRDGLRIGPNAFAMPSGDIVVTDQLVALARDDREVLGVLAHEIGHVQRRHALRQLMQGATLVIAINILLGDMGDMSGNMAALMNLTYSRDFEREADEYAAALMRANHVDPRRLADLLQRLDPAGAKESSGLIGYFQSHPVTAERVQRLRALALGVER